VREVPSAALPADREEIPPLIHALLVCGDAVGVARFAMQDAARAAVARMAGLGRSAPAARARGRRRPSPGNRAVVTISELQAKWRRARREMLTFRLLTGISLFPHQLPVPRMARTLESRFQTYLSYTQHSRPGCRCPSRQRGSKPDAIRACVEQVERAVRGVVSSTGSAGRTRPQAAASGLLLPGHGKLGPQRRLFSQREKHDISHQSSVATRATTESICRLQYCMMPKGHTAAQICGGSNRQSSGTCSYAPLLPRKSFNPFPAPGRASMIASPTRSSPSDRTCPKHHAHMS
jgi:hypothetical protein